MDGRTTGIGALVVAIGLVAAGCGGDTPTTSAEAVYRGKTESRWVALADSAELTSDLQGTIEYLKKAEKVVPETHQYGDRIVNVRAAHKQAVEIDANRERFFGPGVELQRDAQGPFINYAVQEGDNSFRIAQDYAAAVRLIHPTQVNTTSPNNDPLIWKIWGPLPDQVYTGEILKLRITPEGIKVLEDRASGTSSSYRTRDSGQLPDARAAHVADSMA